MADAGRANTHTGTLSCTVAICTAGRVDTVTGGFARLAPVVAPGTEVLVVNNGPRADHRALCIGAASAFAGTGIRWEVLQEDRAGVSWARNRVLEHARTDVVTYLDDDASPVDSGWQSSMLRVLADRADVAMVTGPVLMVPPWGPGGYPPRWRSARTDGLLSCGGEDQATGYCHPTAVYGGNVAYRRDVIGNLRFDTELGWRRGQRRALAGEETLLNMQLAATGVRAWFEATAPVHHFVALERMSVGWMLRRAFALGQTQGQLAQWGQLLLHDAPGARIRAARLLAMASAKGAIRLGQGRIDRAFANLCDVALASGWLLAPRPSLSVAPTAGYSGPPPSTPDR